MLVGWVGGSKNKKRSKKMYLRTKQSCVVSKQSKQQLQTSKKKERGQKSIKKYYLIMHNGQQKA